VGSQSSRTGRRVARVAVDSPLPQLDRLFDYEVPQALAGEVVPGVRVRVSVRAAGRMMDGWVVELADSSDYAGALSVIDAVVSPVPALAPEVWALARKVAERSAGTTNDVLRLAIPTRSVRAEQPWRPGAVPPPEPPAAPAAPAIDGYRPGELENVIVSGERISLDARPHVVVLGSGATVGAWALTLAQLASATVAKGSTAILIAPDHRDLDQLDTAVRDVVGAERLVRLDAAQSTPARYRDYLRARFRSGLVVIGSRSAVYAPAHRLGLIAIWDDGDPLHREPHAPGVHVRDAALVRQELQGGALVLAGHAVSTETQRLTEIGWTRRVTPVGARAPRIIPTALATGAAADDHARIPSTAWQGVRSALASGPVLVQVGRPGYSPQLSCARCAAPAHCPTCSGPLGIPGRGRAPSCRWCGALAARWRCPECDGAVLRPGVAGSVRTADELGRAFPKTKIVIADGSRTVMSVDDTPALVVATRGAEPVAAGGYRAVLLLDGDRMLAREGLRVTEDCMRWWSNAIALGAPDATTWIVGVGGRLAAGLAGWRQAGVAAAELTQRRELRFPPAVRVATVTGRSAVVDEVIAALGLAPIDVLGPVPTDGAAVRCILRFDYQRGHDVALVLREAVIRHAAARRAAARSAGRSAPARAEVDLRVRFDDVDAFDVD
jgi:primosomal protein N' (replication factor Y)